MQNFSYTTLALFATLFTWSLTALGAACVVFFKQVNKNWMDGMLGFAGGAMLYVTSDEMIPETHAHGYQKQATYALLLGFLTRLFMERMFE